MERTDVHPGTEDATHQIIKASREQALVYLSKI